MLSGRQEGSNRIYEAMEPIDKEIGRKVEEIARWAKNDLPRLAGKTAVDHFSANFDKEGFVNGGLQKWPDVKRRDASSPWYGFDYTGEKRTSYAFRRDRKTGKTRKADKQKKLNFSRNATQRKVLNGSTHELQRSLRYVVGNGAVSITSDKPYAAIQNDGGTIRVFGRQAVQLPARPFVGESRELDEKIDRIIDNKLNEVFNK